MHVPGHTPADMAYQVGDAVFVGDTMFMPDVAARAATSRWLRRRPVQIGAPPAVAAAGNPPVHVPRLPACRPRAALGSHGGRAAPANIHIRDGVSEEEFVAMRTKRDATLQDAGADPACDPGRLSSAGHYRRGRG